MSIEELSELQDLRALVQLFLDVWGTSGEPPLNSDTLRALAHSGNYIAGIRGPEGLVGGAVGWFGRSASGKPILHSHILGVRAGSDAHGLGFALKQHQRSWCLARNVPTIEWTFDPLVRRNAHFNLTKLGAAASEYLVDFYGDMTDGINVGDESDRILIRWDLGSEKALAAAEGRPAQTSPGPEAVMVRVPEDIVAIRRHDPELARGWRTRVREELGGAMARGSRVAGFTREFEYVLEPN